MGAFRLGSAHSGEIFGRGALWWLRALPIEKAASDENRKPLNVRLRPKGQFEHLSLARSDTECLALSAKKLARNH
jgi:hypothetical protein